MGQPRQSRAQRPSAGSQPRPSPSSEARGACAAAQKPGCARHGTVTHLSPETASPGSRGLLAGRGHNPPAARRGGPPRRSRGMPSRCTTAGRSPRPRAEAPGARARGAGAAGRRATQHRPGRGPRGAGRRRTYRGLQKLQVRQGLAQESHAGRPGGQEGLHRHRGTRGPIRQACRANQKSLPVRGCFSIVISGLGARHQPLGHCPMSETRTGSSEQVACSGWRPAGQN